MRTCVLTPTRRWGGVDVAIASLAKQTSPTNTWLVADDLYDKRLEMWDKAREGADGTIVVMDSAAIRECTGLPSTLASSFAWGVERARHEDADLLILLCDYIWTPPDGIERFQKLATTFPEHLLTGLCSHSRDPDASHVTDPRGHFSVYAEPYDGHMPTEIGWKDVREWEARRRYKHDGPVYTPIDIEWWEGNWAAIPRALLHDERLNFSPEYDRGIGHENTDYALKAEALGYGRVLDTANHAIELPHRDYFAAEWAELEELRREQMRWHELRRDTARIPL